MSKKTDSWASFKKKYGDSSVTSMVEAVSRQIPRIPTGIFNFDRILGGGLPLWSFNIFFGNKSSGKTTTTFRAVNSFLSEYKDKDCLFMDFEKSFDPEWASKFISAENQKRFHRVVPLYGEEGVDMVVEALTKIETIGAIVIDSLATMIPIKDAENSAYDDTMGLQAKLTNKLIRKLYPINNKAYRDGVPLLIILINHLRINMKSRGYQVSYEKPCGILQNMVASLDIRFSTKEYHKKGDIPYKVTHSFVIEKSKVSGVITKRIGEFSMMLVDYDGFKAGELDEFNDVFDYGKKTGVIVREGNIWKVGNKDFKTIAEMQQYLKDNPDSFQNLKKMILKQCFVLPILSLEGGEGIDKTVQDLSE